MLRNAQRLQALRAQAPVLTTRVGAVTNYQPFMVRLSLLPEQTLTGWLPVATPWAGNGWGFFAAPVVGAMMEVEYLDGDVNGGIAVASLFNDAAQALSVPSGELWIVHAKGGFFKLTNDGKVTFSDGQGASITLDGAGHIDSAASTWTHTGKLSVSGDITGAGKITASSDIASSGGNVSDSHGSIQSMRSTYDSHTHVAPSGGGPTSAPAQPM
ncbi:MAG: phage baseplate assembly protein V [Steroidobacteraceae bacterium]